MLATLAELVDTATTATDTGTTEEYVDDSVDAEITALTRAALAATRALGLSSLIMDYDSVEQRPTSTQPAVDPAGRSITAGRWQCASICCDPRRGRP